MTKPLREMDITSVHADFCRVFSDPKRIKILWFLGATQRRVSEIAEHLGVSMQNASQHLRVMRDKGAVNHSKKGQTVFYRVSNKKFLEASKLIRKGLLEQLKKNVL
jgi:DNA-binding transcriptional ArsR family regulator